MSDQPEHTIDANYFIYWEQRALTAERKHTEALAEVERLKAALRQVIAGDHPGSHNGAIAVARAALEHKP